MATPIAVTIKPSVRAQKKFTAVFELANGRQRTVHFGAAGASDYTQHGDDARKDQYLARHAPRENWDAPMTAGALARWVLWNRENLRDSIIDYAQRFDLQLQ